MGSDLCGRRPFGELLKRNWSEEAAIFVFAQEPALARWLVHTYSPGEGEAAGVGEPGIMMV